MPGKGWLQTQALKAGMPVITKDGDRLMVASVEKTETRAPVFNLTVESIHTYFVGELQILVHNCKKVGDLPKPPTGPGSVPKSERDPKRLFTPKERDAKRAEQGGKCATGCGKDIDKSNSQGHHIERHADGGPTTNGNHAEVCTECHDQLHAKD